MSATRASSCFGPATRSPDLDPAAEPAATAPGSSWRASTSKSSSGWACARRTRDRSRCSIGAAQPTRRKAEELVKTIADLAEHANLIPLWGRKVLDLRPVAGIDKGSAVHRLLVDHAPLDAAIFAGDDRTDLDAFRALPRLAGTSRLGTAVRLGVFTEESPAEIETEADLVVAGTDGVLDVLRALRLMLFSELLRMTVLLIAGVATALGAISVLLAKQEDPSTVAIVVVGPGGSLATVMGLGWGTAERTSRGPMPRAPSRADADGAAGGIGRPYRLHAPVAHRRLRDDLRDRGDPLSPDRGHRRRVRDPHRARVAPA